MTQINKVGSVGVFVVVFVSFCLLFLFFNDWCQTEITSMWPLLLRLVKLLIMERKEKLLLISVFFKTGRNGEHIRI